MPPRKNRPELHGFVILPVALIILGAVALSAASLLENMRFGQATSQILWFVNTVRAFAQEQQTFFLIAGQDVWDGMIQAGQIAISTKHTNPWNGDLRAIAVTNTTMRIESGLPAQACRRIALYLLEMSPSDLGLLSIEGQADQDTTWAVIYPVPPAEQLAVAENSCGKRSQSHLAMTFKVK